MIGKFKRQELRDYLVSERILGDAVAHGVDIEFLKDPKSAPDLVLECYRVALEKLGYRVENLHQPPPSMALSDCGELFDEGYWIRRNVKSRLVHLFKRYHCAAMQVTLVDVLAPTAARFALIMSNMLNIHWHRTEMSAALAQVDEQVEDKRRQTRHQQQQLDQLKETVQQSRPGHERNVKEVAKLREEIASTERATQDIMNKANVLKVQMQEKEEQKERAQRQARSSSSEVEMLKKEKTRLEELVVTDPGHWERAFEARQADIEQTKRTIGHLKMERV